MKRNRVHSETTVDSTSDPAVSWGGYPQIQGAQHIFSPRSFSEAVDVFGKARHSVLPRGLGRSYGDSCLNVGEALLRLCHCDNIVSFDKASGVLVAEAGISLKQIINVCLPQGWFIPVSPGTKFVTLGGSVANDVHGKNHHSAGTFGAHVLWFELLRSNGDLLRCSASENTELFAATIGGLGLTGLITRVALQMKPVSGPFIDQEVRKFSCLEEFFELSARLDGEFEYTVAWIDSLAVGRKLGRGHFICGNHSSRIAEPSAERMPDPLLSVPIFAPKFLLSPLTIRAFNFLYYHRQLPKQRNSVVHCNPFFYPLDALAHWNRLYGSRGFLQFQCVVPFEKHGRTIREVLDIAARSGRASFLAVLKIFGDKRSPGLLSFPRPGITLCLDFPFEGAATLALMQRLEEAVLAVGGALYPAKDAVMSEETFRASYPKLGEFLPFLDEGISSSFARRVGLDTRGEAS